MHSQQLPVQVLVRNLVLPYSRQTYGSCRDIPSVSFNLLQQPTTAIKSQTQNERLKAQVISWGPFTAEGGQRSKRKHGDLWPRAAGLESQKPSTWKKKKEKTRRRRAGSEDLPVTRESNRRSRSILYNMLSSGGDKIVRITVIICVLSSCVSDRSNVNPKCNIELFFSCSCSWQLRYLWCFLSSWASPSQPRGRFLGSPCLGQLHSQQHLSLSNSIPVNFCGSQFNKN